MKKTIQLSLMAILSIITSIAFGQTPSYVYPGGTSNNNFPFNTTSSNKVQWVYLPTNFTPNLQAGLITHIYFKSNNSASTTKTFDDLRISIAHSSLTTFPNGTFITGLTECYNQTTTINIPSTGWFGVQLATPFVYDGTSNLIIEATITNTTGLTVGQDGSGGNKRIWGGRTSTSGSTGTGLSACGMEIVTCSTAITQHPVTTTICEGNATSYSIQAIDVNSYQWQVDEGNGYIDVINSSIYTGANTSKLNVTNTPAGFDGLEYRCLIMNANQSCSDTSDTAQIFVNQLVNIESYAKADTTCINATKEIEIKADGSIIGYKWQILIPSQGYVDIANQPPYTELGNILRINGAPDTLDGSKYRCIITGLCDEDTSSDLSLTVNNIPKVATHPTDQLAKQGDNVFFEVQASAANARYKWQVASSNSPFSNINNNGIYSGVNTNRLTVNGVSYAQNNFEFRCVIITSDNCDAPGDTSNAAVLSVEQPASVSTLSSKGNVIIYPNPAQGSELFVDVTTVTKSESLSYSIVDKTGRIMSKGNISKGSNTINISNLTPDIYIIEISDNNKFISKSRFTKL